MLSVIAHCVLDRDTQYRPISRQCKFCYQSLRQRIQLELIHDQLPLAVPCYDLVLVIEFTVVRLKDDLRALPTPLT